MSDTNETTACPPDFWRKLVAHLDRALAPEPEPSGYPPNKPPQTETRCQLPSRMWWRARQRAESRHARS